MTKAKIAELRGLAESILWIVKQEEIGFSKKKKVAKKPKLVSPKDDIFKYRLKTFDEMQRDFGTGLYKENWRWQLPFGWKREHDALLGKELKYIAQCVFGNPNLLISGPRQVVFYLQGTQPISLDYLVKIE